MDRPQIEIIAIGNEILWGQVQDTNTHWLIKQVTGQGGQVRRAVIVPDQPDAIIREVRAALERRPALLITTGGLGPTADDLTLSAIAEAGGRPLELNPQALEMMERRYARLAEQGFVADASLTSARKKMAYLPQGAVPLANSVGTAPGCLLRLGATTLISLPGVPGEMTNIWEKFLPPFLQEIFGSGAYVEKTVIVHIRDESFLAPTLEELTKRHRRVYIKSRVRVFGNEVRIRVTFSASGSQKEEIRTLVEKALEGLEQALSTLHIPIEEEPAAN